MCRTPRKKSNSPQLATLLAMLCVASAGLAQAVEVVIDNGLAPPNPVNVIDSDNSSVDFVIRGPVPGVPTTVLLEAGGSTAALALGEFGVLTITGGSVEGLLEVSHYSSLSMSGGSLNGGLRQSGFATAAALTGGNVTGGVVSEGLADLTIGGSVLIDNVVVNQSSYMTMDAGSVLQGLSTASSAVGVITGGSVSGYVAATEDSSISISGGSLTADVGASGQAFLTIRGGSVGLSLSALDTSTLEIIGTGFSIDGVPVAFGPIDVFSGTLTGLLESGDPIDNAFSRGAEATIMLSADSAAVPVRSEDAALFASDGGLNPDPEASTPRYIGFGSAVAIEGDTALIGAFAAFGEAHETGAAYVYYFDGSAWVEEAKLMAPSPATGGAEFGVSVALSGNTALIGAPEDLSDYPLEGSVFVFGFDGSEWVEEAKLATEQADSFFDFGSQVALDGDVALVSAPGGHRNGILSGSAFVFRHDGDSWIEEASLFPSDGQTHERFGQAIGLAGDSALIGRCPSVRGSRPSGAVYAFRYDGTSWIEEAILELADAGADDYFGCRIAMSGDTALIFGGSTAVYVYRYDGNSWVQEATLSPSDVTSSDSFGNALALEGNTAVIGAQSDDPRPYAGGGSGGTGTAHVFRYDGTSWIEDARFNASVGEPADEIGSAVAISGDTVVVGASGTRNPLYRNGAAYVFSLPEPSAMTLHSIALAALAAVSRRRAKMALR